MRRGFWIGLTITCIAVVHGLAWYLVGNQIRDRMTAWIDQAGATGTEITFKALLRGGFPFAVRWTLVEPALAAPWARGNLDAAAGSVSLNVGILNPARFTLSGQGLRLTVGDGPTGTHWILRSETGSATIEPSKSGAIDVAYRLASFRVDETKPGGRAAPIRLVGQAERAGGAARIARPRPAGKPLAVHQASIELDDITSPKLERTPLNGSGRLTGTFGLHGGLGRASIEDIVEWRDLGGIIDIESLKIDWRPFNLSFDGTLALDAELRPIGAGTADLRGLGPLIDREVERGGLKQSDASVAKLALALMTRPAKDGGEPVVRLPLTAQDGKLKAGPFSVGKLPRLIR